MWKSGVIREPIACPIKGWMLELAGGLGDVRSLTGTISLISAAVWQAGQGRKHFLRPLIAAGLLCLLQTLSTLGDEAKTSSIFYLWASWIFFFYFTKNLGILKRIFKLNSLFLYFIISLILNSEEMHASFSASPFV